MLTIFSTFSTLHYSLVQYCLDYYDFENYCEDLYNAFKDSFKLPGMFPAGKLCTLQLVEKDLQPQSGPFAFITPPGAFTKLHRDGGVSQYRHLVFVDHLNFRALLIQAIIVLLGIMRSSC